MGAAATAKAGKEVPSGATNYGRYGHEQMGRGAIVQNALRGQERKVFMKRTKRIFAIFMTLALAMSMLIVSSVVSFAADGDRVITINDAKEVTGVKHTYSAYKIFSGTVKDGQLQGIAWADGVDSTALLAELKTDNATKDAFKDATTAVEVADVLGKITTKDADLTKAFARIASKHLGTAAGTSTESKAPYTITVNGDGYYLVLESANPSGTVEPSADSQPGDAMTRVIVGVVGADVAIDVKKDTTSSEKKVKDINDTTDSEAGSWQDSADWDVGDEVPFQLKATIAQDYDAYKVYKLTFHDKEDTGLTFKSDSVKVYVDGTEITSGYELVTSPTDGDTFEVKFADLKQIASVKAGSVITVEYKSTLNDNAVRGAAGNKNKMHITYSNNPNDEQGGENGTTPDDTVKVFVYKVVVNKVDENNKPLAGAEFKLEKVNKDGSKTVITTITATDGKSFTFDGLDDGEYILTETKEPTGYNKIDPITFTVSATHDPKAVDPQLTELKAETTATEIVFTASKTDGAFDGTLTTTVKNQSGATLPETGGIGTIIFYVLGSLLVVGCGIVLISKRRMESR